MPHRRKSVLLAVLAVVAILCVAALLWHRYWPFESKTVIENLEEAGDSKLEVRAFRRTYFPPGCILEGVVFRHSPEAKQPLITIERLTIRATYLGILAHRVSDITAEGMHVVIPPFGSAPTFHTSPSSIRIGEILADGATVEFASRNPDTPPLRFEVRQASLQDVGWDGPLTYRLKVHNPEPPGEIAATGKFGAWNENEPENTPVSGEYKFEHADLSVYHGIAGLLSSEGKFGGKLGHIDISGTTDTPAFEVRMGEHPVHLTSNFKAYVDGIHGDTYLERVDAHFRHTNVVAQGSIAKSANGKGKTALLDLSSNHGRIEDILSFFVKKDRAPMSGAITLRAKVEIPPSEKPFLEKITLKGGFGIGAGEFSSPSTQEGVNKLSAGARGEKDTDDPETVLTDLTGQLTLTDGVGHFNDLSFGVPGAAARMHGTYNVVNHKIDLQGQMQVDTKISKTTSGAKALLLNMMDPFFKKRKKGEIVPVRISGTYEHPTFGLDLNDKKAQQVAPPPQPPKATAPPHP